MQVYTDSHVSTKYHWARPHTLSPESTATITWDIPDKTLSGAPCISYQVRKCALTFAVPAPIISAERVLICSIILLGDSWNLWQCKSISHALLMGTSHDAGTYRLQHFGDYKHIFGGPVPFNGTSSSFEVCSPTGLLSRICSTS